MAKPAKPSKSYSQSTQDVWSPQGDALQDLYSGANDWYNNNKNTIQQGAYETSAMQAQNYGDAIPAWQQQLQGGNLGGYDITGALGHSLGQSMTNPTNEQQAIAGGMNNYSDAYRQNFMNDARGAMDTSLAATDSRAAASGMSGGSRHGNLQAQGLQDINSNLQYNLANIGYQDYTNNINRQQQAGANADQLRGQQQQQLAGLAGMQNSNISGAIGQQSDIGNYTNAALKSYLQSAGGLQQLAGLLGNPVSLTQSETTQNGGVAGGGANVNLGTGGANISF